MDAVVFGLYLEACGRAIGGEVADVPGNRFGVVVVGHGVAVGEAALNKREVFADDVRHHSVFTGGGLADLRGPLGHDVAELRGIILVRHIDIMCGIGGEAAKITAGVVVERNADGVELDAGVFQRGRLFRTVPFVVIRRFSVRAGSTVGNEDHIGAAALFRAAIEDRLCLGQCGGVVSAAVGGHGAHCRLDRGNRVGEIRRSGDCFVGCAAVFFVAAGEADDRHPVAAVIRQNIACKRVADGHCG